MLLICFAFFTGCNNRIEQKNSNDIEKLYVISREDQKVKNEIDSINSLKNESIALPRKCFYSENNLIIDKDNFVYYYQRRFIPIFCDYGMENDTLPHFLNLQPKDLVRIPKDVVEKIITENVMSKEKKKQILVIGSQKDTIKDLEFLKFLHQLKVPIYLVRRTTQEEDTVLYYKKIDKYYNSDEIKWDKTKIKFPK